MNKGAFKYYVSTFRGGGDMTRNTYIVYAISAFLGWVQNLGKPAYIILARSLRSIKRNEILTCPFSIQFLTGDLESVNIT